MAKILGIRIDNVIFQEAMAKITAFLMVDEFHMIATVNPEFIVAAQKDEAFKEILNSTDLNVPDGVGLKYASWFFGEKIGGRITGVDLTWEICKLAAEKGYSIYFLGGAEGVAEKAISRIKLVHPKIKIAGFASPLVSAAGEAENNTEVINTINESQADILLVALGAPKQEKFLSSNRAILTSKVGMGIGGTFDYIAGVVPYAPKWVRSVGLEWFYRLFTQPKRWKRIFTAVIIFPWLVVKSRIKK
jgi:N-acetylglucosaminyldiphosphoundecaprenol N-acetyl-beta-D-mannosaminyltransferase